ncbi:hypothetical protein FB645_004079 [Coemansia sp. IMI 203386]|nr:hypothetical protein FB645_004079 [Coemansia sp. IMI 203386]
MGHLMTPSASPRMERFDHGTAAPSPVPISSASSFSSTTRRDKWAQVFELALRSVVHITTNVHVNFDTHMAGQSTATGFVVDADLGVILTNRHVMTCAPATHIARFENTESIRVTPWYYDPVFDFAFFRYSPADLKTALPEAIRLVPEKAAEGLEIRVISCDSGEPISVSSGTIADTKRRPACAHCCFDYHEFNTFYCVAAAGTRGGSSGAPVLDIEGDAVALNVGGIDRTQQSLFRPLHRVVKTLEQLRQGTPPPRGTLQAMFQFVTNEHLTKAGLPLADIQRLYPQFVATRGMIKVDCVVPGSPADQLLRVGDVIFAANSYPVTDFESLLNILDHSVDQSVNLSIFRDKTLMSVAVPVTDLYSITPSKLLRIGTGCPGTNANLIFCDVSYVTAITIQAPRAGVLVCGTNTLFSSVGIGRGSIITRINGKLVKDLDDFVEKITSHRSSIGIMMEYVIWNAPSSPKIVVVPSIPDFYAYEIMQRHAQSGQWSTTNIRSKSSAKIASAQLCAIPVTLRPTHSQFQQMHASIVHIAYHSMASVGSILSCFCKGYGYIASKKHGIIVCDRSTVPSHTGSISVTVANTVVIDAWVEYIDPLSCYVYLRYNPSSITEHAVEEAPVLKGCQSDCQLRVGEDAMFITPADGDMPILCRTQIEMRTLLPLHDLDPNNEHILNIDALLPKERPNHISQSFICDMQGNLCAMWVIHTKSGIDRDHERIVFGVDIQQTLPIIERLIAKQPVHPRSLNVEFSRLSLLNACVYGLSNQRAAEFSRDVPYSRSVYVVRRAPGSESNRHDLQVNDVVLKANGKWIDSVSHLAAFYDESAVELLVCREGEEMTIVPALFRVHSEPVKRLVHWSGMCIEPFSGLNHKQRKWPSEGVCIGNTSHGSPASHIYGPQLITHINEQPIKNMSDLVIAIKNTKSEKEQFLDRLLNDKIGVADALPGALVKIKMINKTGVVHDAIIETDDLYYPPSCLELEDNNASGWVWKLL